jgi:hypothetical protein
MTKLEASVDKDVALVAKTNRLPAETCWYIFQAQVSNNLGQPVLADFLVVGLNTDGNIHRKPFHLIDFIKEFRLHESMHTESITEIELGALQQTLVKAVAYVTSYMSAEQKQLEVKMENKMNEYQQKLTNWKNEALEQLELDFSDKTITPFFSGKKDSKKREIETILSSTSQYNKDMTSLQGEAYFKVLAVFFNA